MYRFSCGLNSGSAEKIISYLKNIEGGDKFAILCILEQSGKVEHIKEIIRQLCCEGVIISGYDSLLLQRSSMQLLEIAARNGILIEYVSLSNCLQSVDTSAAAIKTTSGLVFTSRIPVKWIEVSLYNRDMTEDEATDVLKFASMCPSLRLLVYGYCVPPQSFEDGLVLSNLKSRNVQVWWQGADAEPIHILNLQSGRWENRDSGSEPTAKDFERMRSVRGERRIGRTKEMYREIVKVGRENLRGNR
ncbi:hypothetical protein HOLleu_01395 [Holothuria leucospilota]|uniref:Uncharacterized protein n=1 Tax=Holothuria leucospilota TaxID=206669 RepID=A0A9Q1CQ93_HOLLE|nr:hypothetical protein HOLleu_01395 [Holothuria leucospilota]